MEDTRHNSYLILGSGIAGMSAAEEIRSADPSAIIRMVTEEEDICTNRPMLIMDFSPDGSGSALFEEQETLPTQLGIDLIKGVRATSIDPSVRSVALSDGRELSYDILIYALGATPMIPDIPGADGKKVFSVRDLEDTKRIKGAIEGAESAVVIGGGMLGIEDAWALYREKLSVTVLEQRQRIAFGQIDQSAGNLMKKRIERMGVPVHVGVTVEEIGDGYVAFREMDEETESGSAEGAELTKIPADMVILSTGVVPNSELGCAAGLRLTGTEGNGPGWIAVDEHCRTSDPRIYAAGDAAAAAGGSDAIWDEAKSMGRIAGANAAIDLILSEGSGSDEAERPRYERIVPEHVFNGFDTEIFTMGDSSGEETGETFIRHADVEIFDYQRERYIRVSLYRGKIAGILLINASELAPDLMKAYRDGAGKEEVRAIISGWKKDHDVDFKPAEPFRKR